MGWAPPPLPSREVLDKLRASGDFDAWAAEERRMLKAAIVHAGDMKRYCAKWAIACGLVSIALAAVTFLM